MTFRLHKQGVSFRTIQNTRIMYLELGMFNKIEIEMDDSLKPNFSIYKSDPEATTFALMSFIGTFVYLKDDNSGFANIATENTNGNTKFLFYFDQDGKIAVTNLNQTETRYLIKMDPIIVSMATFGYAVGSAADGTRSDVIIFEMSGGTDVVDGMVAPTGAEVADLFNNFQEISETFLFPDLGRCEMKKELILESYNTADNCLGKCIDNFYCNNYETNTTLNTCKLYAEDTTPLVCSFDYSNIPTLGKLINGRTYSQGARLAKTTGEITLASTPKIDGVQTVVGDRVLLTAQKNPKMNGIWVVESGFWTRPGDFKGTISTDDPIILLLITEGTEHSDSTFYMNTPNATMTAGDQEGTVIGSDMYFTKFIENYELRHTFGLEDSEKTTQSSNKSIEDAFYDNIVSASKYLKSFKGVNNINIPFNTTTENIDECAEVCLSRPDCKYIKYDPATKNCLTGSALIGGGEGVVMQYKDRNSIKTYEIKSSSEMATVQNAETDAAHTDTETYYTGARLCGSTEHTLTTTDKYGECKTKCVDDPVCKYFSFNDSVCKLSGSACTGDQVYGSYSYNIFGRDEYDPYGTNTDGGNGSGTGTNTDGGAGTNTDGGDGTNTDGGDGTNQDGGDGTNQDGGDGTNQDGGDGSGAGTNTDGGVGTNTDDLPAELVFSQDIEDALLETGIFTSEYLDTLGTDETLKQNYLTSLSEFDDVKAALNDMKSEYVIAYNDPDRTGAIISEDLSALIELMKTDLLDSLLTLRESEDLILGIGVSAEEDISSIFDDTIFDGTAFEKLWVNLFG